MIDGGRLPEVHPADVVAAVETLNPGHAGEREREREKVGSKVKSAVGHNEQQL